MIERQKQYVTLGWNLTWDRYKVIKRSWHLSESGELNCLWKAKKSVHGNHLNSLHLQALAGDSILKDILHILWMERLSSTNTSSSRSATRNYIRSTDWIIWCGSRNDLIKPNNNTDGINIPGDIVGRKNDSNSCQIWRQHTQSADVNRKALTTTTTTVVSYGISLMWTHPSWCSVQTKIHRVARWGLY